MDALWSLSGCLQIGKIISKLNIFLFQLISTQIFKHLEYKMSLIYIKGIDTIAWYEEKGVVYEIY